MSSTNGGRGWGLGSLHLRGALVHEPALSPGLVRNWQADGEWQVLDLTRYMLPARESQGMGRNWSLMGDINQKGTRPQDRPRPFGELSQDLQRTVLLTYPDLEV